MPKQLAIEKPSKTIEDYLKTICLLSRNGKPISTSEIAEHFRIALASVTEMMKFVDTLEEGKIQSVSRIPRVLSLFKNFLKEYEEQDCPPVHHSKTYS